MAATQERLKGSYLLLMRLDQYLQTSVGRLGTFDFAPGYFLYFGSARAGLKSRIGRHQRREKTLHWHIDYLTRSAKVVKVWWAPGDARLECVWARAAVGLPGATVPAKGFGASDCSCPSHLVRVETLEQGTALAAGLPGQVSLWPPQGE